MLDMKAFGEKLKNHRKKLGMTQEEVAARIGVSGQAVSKWEVGECLPDCFNLKALAEIYGISLDILLETEKDGDIDSTAAKIEQLADEFIWRTQSRGDNAHRDLGGDLWKMWKGIYFIETGDHDKQKTEKQAGNLRVCSEYGLKIWDEDGIACVIQKKLADKEDMIGEREFSVLATLCTPDAVRLIASLDTNTLTDKQTLAQKCGIEPQRLNELLLELIENRIIEFESDKNAAGYKIAAYRGIAAYLILAAGFVIAKNGCCISEYINRTE